MILCVFSCTITQFKISIICYVYQIKNDLIYVRQQQDDYGASVTILEEINTCLINEIVDKLTLDTI
jgi:hypothetical protein